MSKFLTNAKKKYVNMRGYHTTRKLLAIESDDWGSIRTPPSNKVLNSLRRYGDHPERNAFVCNDCLEREEDLYALFEVLMSVCDCKNNSPVITSNFATSNPDFDKIYPDRGIYVYEPFYQTYDRYYPNNLIMTTIIDGINKKIFVPQLHCREHVNVARWMLDLKRAEKSVTIAFQHRMVSIADSFSEKNRFGYTDAFNFYGQNKTYLQGVIKEAAIYFRRIFGYTSETFVAPCFVWFRELESTLKEVGVRGIQTSYWQNVPIAGSDRFKRKIHYTGERNRCGQVFTVRNCSFEPSYNYNVDYCVQHCLAEIGDAFRNGKPAIINSHRFNYVGAINPENSKNNLIGLKYLLKKVVETYPDVEFISTPQLVGLIQQER